VTTNITKLDRAAIWILITLCVLVIPAGILTTNLLKNKESPESSSFVSSLEDRLIVLKLTGMIVESDDDGLLSSVNTVDSVKRKLKKALKDKHVKGILLRIDSPGGTVASSQELSDYVKAVRKAGIPVVASMGDVAASGGYYVASACDRIVAQPGTITGSIGVIMNTLSLAGLEEKLGIEPQTVKSGQFKDIGSPTHRMTPAERELLQAMIMESYDQFVTAVAEGRHMDKEAVKKLADGRMYLGKQAKALGLIDSLGSYETAIASLQEMARARFKLTKDLPVDEGRRRTYFSQILDLIDSKTSQPNMLESVLPAALRSRFYHMPLWLMQ
jgi:protease-4